MLNVKLQKGLHLSMEHKTPLVDPQNLTLGKVVAGLAYKVDKNTKTALQAYKVDEKVRVQAGLHTKLKDNKEVKLKVDNKGKFTILGKGKLNDSVTGTVSAQFNFQEGSKFIDMDKSLPLPFGYQLDWKL